MGDKTELQREILLTWYDNPEETNKEIAKACDCSASYVSEVKSRFGGYNQFEAMMDRRDEELEQMFGNDIYASPAASTGTPGNQGFAELWNDIPDGPAGLLIKAVIVVVFLFVGYQIALIPI